MLKKEYKKMYMVVLLVIYQSFFYLISKLSPFEMHVLGNSFDDKIPFIPVFIYFYVGWYLMLFVVPFLFLKDNEKTFYKYIISTFICISICCLIYFIYPTTIIREPTLSSGITSFVVKFIYAIDTPILNCFPSMHCIICFMFMFYTWGLKNTNKYLKITIQILSLLVILSTVFVKQHVVIDIISALVIAIIVYFVSRYIKIPKWMLKKN